jgi:probable HAF family extracellular repeat protein
VMTDLGSIGSDPCSRATSINERGQIVGLTAAVCGGPATHGFLWEKGGPAVDLNSLVAPGSGLALTEPTSINERGEIAGVGTLPNGAMHAFVLIPCGEGTEGCVRAPEGVHTLTHSNSVSDLNSSTRSYVAPASAVFP